MLLNEIKSLEEVEVTLRVNLMLPALADKLRYVIDALIQPQGEWVALTDDEVWDAVDDPDLSDGSSGYVEWCIPEVAEAIIAKFKDKNTPPVVPQGEPVAWIHTFMGVDQINTTPPEIYGKDWTHQPLYTTPPSSQRADALVEAAIEATKEKAAKVCMKQQYDLQTRQTFAAAIRSMK